MRLLSATRDDYTGVDFNLGYHVRHYALDLTYRVIPNRLEGTATITLTTSTTLSSLNLDLMQNMRVRKVIATHKVARFRHSGNKVRIVFAQDVPADSEVQISVRYSGTPRGRRTVWGDLGWEELESGSLVASQPNGAPSWFPCDDTPAQKATYDIRITADNPFTVVSNGQLVDKRTRNSTTTWHYRTARPMATYLVTVQVGEYVRAGDIWCPPELVDAATAAFAPQQDMITLFERLFGPYPFDDYSVVITPDDLDIPLEAQGLSIFGANMLTPKWERLIAHELAHQWFGNSLGLTRWNDIWLNEGFACYSEWLWFEHTGTFTENPRQHYDGLAAKPQDIIIGDPGAHDMFDDRVYKRGALTLHALRVHLGDTAFFDALRAYVAAGRHSVVNPTDLRTQLHRVGNPHQIDTILDQWLWHPTLPEYPQ